MYSSKIRFSVLFAGIIFILIGCTYTQGNNVIEIASVKDEVSLEKLSPPTMSPIKITATNLPVKTPSPAQIPTLTLSNKPTLTPTPTVTMSLEIGSTLISSKVEMVLLYIPAGDYFMGSTNQDFLADIDEFPQHKVYLDSYWIGRTEVTNGMYAIFLNDMGNQTEGNAAWLTIVSDEVLLTQDSNGIWHPKNGFDEYPVIEVTWYGAQSFCQWIGGRLPTEAEWEKAARGIDNRIFPWGEEIDCTKAQYINCGNPGLLPVGSKTAGASLYNILDMAGNAWEWVADFYDEAYYAISPVANPPGPDSGVGHVLRGGSWKFDAKHARSANRRFDGPLNSKPDYSFRCVLSAK